MDRLHTRTPHGERMIHGVFIGVASTSVLVVALIFLFIIKEAVPFVVEPGLSQLWETSWVPVSFVERQFGVLPLVTGSLFVTFLATFIAVPFGVICSVYLAEVAAEGENRIFRPFIELLTGIPTVVIGFFGLVVLAPTMKDVFHLNTGLNALTGAILLSLMAVPTIISISTEAVRNVPDSYREASLAVGASRLQTIWRVVVPAALRGISASVLLAMGRVIGETMTVMMVTGNAAVITASPLASVRTMTATIAAEMGGVAYGSVHYAALFWVGLVLLLVTFAVNMAAQKLLRRFRILP